MELEVAVQFFERSGENKNLPFFSGYRPAFKFDNSPEFNSGRIVLLNQENAMPNSTATAIVKFLCPERVMEYVEIGVSFKFYEGRTCLGNCVVLKII